MQRQPDFWRRYWHLKNIFRDAELDEAATTKDFLAVRTEGKRQVERNLKHYNLDAIISVGYRVSSKRGVQFRQWATQRLKDYLVQGYALNQQRLESQRENLDELRQAIALSSRLIHNEALSSDESQGILAILEKYSLALAVLDDYDHQRLQISGTRAAGHPRIGYDEAMAQILRWRAQEGLGSLFGNEKDASFKSSLDTIGSSPVADTGISPPERCEGRRFPTEPGAVDGNAAYCWARRVVYCV